MILSILSITSTLLTVISTEHVMLSNRSKNFTVYIYKVFILKSSEALVGVVKFKNLKFMLFYF